MKVLATLKREREELKLGPPTTGMEGGEVDGNEEANEEEAEGGMGADYGSVPPEGEMGGASNVDGGEDEEDM